MGSSARFSTFERTEIVEKARQCLWTEQGKPGLDYLRDVRKLSDETIERFSLGYIPEHVRHRNPHVPQQSGRIIVPLFDPSGNLIILASREVLPNEYMPKYWHETYEKSFYLYGLNIAKESIRKWRFAIFVEGQFDVMQMHNHGFTNTVGVCSTNLSDIQIAMAHRYCEEFIVMFDTDPNNAGQKGVDKLLPRTKLNAARKDSLFHREMQSLVNSGVYKLEFVHLDVGRNLDGSIKKTDPDAFLLAHGVDSLRPLIREKVRKMRQEVVLEH